MKHYVFNYEENLRKNASPIKIDGIFIILNGRAIVRDIFGSTITKLNVGDIFGEGLLLAIKVFKKKTKKVMKKIYIIIEHY